MQTHPNTQSSEIDLGSAWGAGRSYSFIYVSLYFKMNWNRISRHMDWQFSNKQGISVSLLKTNTFYCKSVELFYPSSGFCGFREVNIDGDKRAQVLLMTHLCDTLTPAVCEVIDPLHFLTDSCSLSRSRVRVCRHFLPTASHGVRGRGISILLLKISGAD